MREDNAKEVGFRRAEISKQISTAPIGRLHVKSPVLVIVTQWSTRKQPGFN